MNNYIEIDCIEIRQPIGVFYIGSINWKDLTKIASADIRRIEKGEGRDIETYLGIQRDLSQKRVKEISDYVKNKDATFPTSVILHISSTTKDEDGFDVETNLSFDRGSRKMRIRENESVANILDGQHRIEGLKEGFKISHENSDSFNLNVTIFVDLDMDDQSMVFATVNKAQTKVNKSLVYDLFDFAKTESPQRTAHLIVKLLNNHNGSPFKNKIKILGTADDSQKETITQATIAEAIINYISKKPMSDRDQLKRGKKLERLPKGKEDQAIFRNMFIDRKDEEIAAIIWNYFLAIQEKWNEAWERTDIKGNILNKSTGFVGFMKFLKPAYLEIVGDNVGAPAKKEQFLKIFEKVQLKAADFNKDLFIPGGSGQSKLYRELCNQTGLTRYLR